MPLNITLPSIARTGLDNSILESNARCPRLALNNYHLNRSVRTINYPIQFGVAYHDFRNIIEQLYNKWVLSGEMELKHAEPGIYETSLAYATRSWEDPPLEHKKGYLDLGRLKKTFSEAFKTWLEEKEGNYYKILAPEAPFELPLPSGRLFTGKIDQVIEWNGSIWIRDFKTLGRKDDWKLKFNPNHQFTGYVWAVQQLSGKRVEGVIIDVVYNIKTKGPEFHPIMANRSEADIENWLEWVEYEYTLWENQVKTNVWPMKTSACGDYNGCYFRKCCNLGSWNSMEHWLLENTIHSHWDPLNPEREEGLPAL